MGSAQHVSFNDLNDLILLTLKFNMSKNACIYLGIKFEVTWFQANQDGLDEITVKSVMTLEKKSRNYEMLSKCHGNC